MTAKNFAIIDAAAVGPALEVQLSGLVLTCNLIGQSGARKARGTIPKSSGTWCYEAAYWGTDAFTGLVALGICTNASSLSAAVGGDANSYGYRAPDGGVYLNNVLQTAANAAPAQHYIGVVVNFAQLKMYIYVDGGLVATQSITAGTWFPAFTVGSVTAYGISQYVNFGQRAFMYNYPSTPTGTDTVAGWYSTQSAPLPLYLGEVGDDAYSSATTDLPASTSYAPVISNTDSLEIEKRSTTWLWNDQSSSSTYGYVDCDLEAAATSGLNTGLAGLMLSKDYRDAPVVIRQLTDCYDTLTNASYTIATCLVDHVELISETMLRCYFKGKMAQLSIPAQRYYFPPWSDTGVANRPMPRVIGACRSVDVGAQLTSQPNLTYALSSAAITNIGVLRDKGNPLDPNATPPGFTPSNDLRSAILATLPQGKLYGDISSCGPQTQYPGAPDVLNGAGSNWDTSWTGANGTLPSPVPVPTGWTLTNTDSPTYTSSAIRQGTPSGYQHQYLTLSSNRPMSAIGPGREFSFKTAGTTLRAGKSYKITFEMYDFQSAGGDLAGCGLVVLSAWASYLNSAQWISPYIQPLIGGFHQAIPFVLTYTVPAGADRQLYFSVCNSHGLQTSCTIRNIVVEELAGQVVQVPLVGSTFQNYVKTVVEQMAGLTSADWSQADCVALDARYPGGPLGVYVGDQINVDDLLNKPMSSVCGAVTEDRLGVLRFKQLRDPLGQTPLATYTNDDIDFGVIISPDYARGLTQSMGCQYNNALMSDTDFVTDFTLVPGALRTQLKRDYRVIQTCNVPLRNTYAFAQLAEAFGTCFDDPVLTLAELVRVNNFYAYNRPGYLPPRFFQFTINYQGQPPDYLLGDVLYIDYQALQTNAFIQQNVAVLGTTLVPGQQKIRIIAWG